MGLFVIAANRSVCYLYKHVATHRTHETVFAHHWDAYFLCDPFIVRRAYTNTHSFTHTFQSISDCLWGDAFAFTQYMFWFSILDYDSNGSGQLHCVFECRTFRSLLILPQSNWYRVASSNYTKKAINFKMWNSQRNIKYVHTNIECIGMNRSVQWIIYTQTHTLLACWIKCSNRFDRRTLPVQVTRNAQIVDQ